MYASWFTSTAGQRLIGLAGDRRPAWLWPREGDQPLWANDAARLFAQSHCDEAEFAPIAGQIKRLLRLGLFSAANRARIPFVACGHPVSLTCSCAPVELQNAETCLLTVGIDPIDEALFATRDGLPPQTFSLLPVNTAYVIADGNGRILGGAGSALELAHSDNLDDARMWEVSDLGAGLKLFELTGEPEQKPVVVAAEPALATPPVEIANASDADADQTEIETESAEAVPPFAEDAEGWEAEDDEDFEGGGSLSRLISRFEGTGTLFTPLGPEDEELPEEFTALSATGQDSGEVPPTVPGELELPSEGAGDAHVPSQLTAPSTEPETDEFAGESGPTEAVEHSGDDGDRLPPMADPEHPSEQEATSQPEIWRVVGRGPVRRTNLAPEPAAAAFPQDDQAPVATAPLTAVAAALDAELAAEPQEPETGSDQNPGEPERTAQRQAEVDKAARYNFDELAKILNERVSGEGRDGDGRSAAAAAPTNPPASPVALDGDLVVLNRLPVGVMIFRDSDILFANRAFTQLVGCDSLDSLRALGLGRIFPHEGDDGTTAGPVLRLISADGVPVRVDARLNSMTWQAAPALVLTAQSAAPADDSSARERYLKSVLLTETLSAARQEGVARVDEHGTIIDANQRVVDIVGHPERVLVGRPLALFVKQADAEKLSDHLARVTDQEPKVPEVLSLDLIGGARAQLVTLPDRPSDSLQAAHLLVVADAAETGPGSQARPDAALLNRLSRGIRRPLNTITGFSQLIEGEAFGPAGTQRYVDYARDINAASREIEGLIDELDDYAQIESGTYPTDEKAFSLGELISECEAKVRHQASVRQVLVRSAVSENLPLVRADRASMRKALLNLLASAIDQSSTGGKVVLSAQYEDDGSVAVHVRDSSSGGDDLADRFSVFREQTGKRDEEMVPLKSSMGLALTRSLLAVNSCSLLVGPASGTGTLMTLRVPQALIVAEGHK
ncbi:MAG: PAS domain-containing protein [Hyphomicrobiaceae bacterium]|nr:PAS domain-containing protein [Hyphomicrobiaceae bacterium]